MSLFNRPAWAKTQTATSDLDEAPDNIFSHSDRSYREIVAEQERKKQTRLEKEKRKQRAKEERRSSGKREPLDHPAPESSPKRRRISLPDEDDSTVTRQHVRHATEVDDIAYDGHEELKRDSTEILGPVRRSPRKNKYDFKDNTLAWQRSFTAEVVDLGDSDSDDNADVQAVSPATQLKLVEVVEEESDDEFAELARRARQQRGKEGVGKKVSQIPDKSYSPNQTQDIRDTGYERSGTSPPDPTIELFISSRLEKTNPMIVYRKLSQNLADVRRVWCAKQGFSERKAQEVYFVHRMRRVYDVTTCRSLGIEVDSLGNLILKGAEGKENVDKVHLEAVTDEVFRQMKAERTQGARGLDGEFDINTGAEEDGSPTAQQPKEEHMRVILKARGREDYKLKVKPNTTFSRIIAAYKKTQQLGNEPSIRLEFDGDQLNPDDEVQSTEISDMDCIDVHVSSH